MHGFTSRPVRSSAVDDINMNEVLLVYAVRPDDGSEPLVAVVGGVDEAAGIERRLAPVTVRWERHELRAGPSDEVSVVFLAAGGAEDGAELADPIGDEVFSSRQEAEKWRESRSPGGEGQFVVRSYPLGWTRPGWPFFDEQG